MKIDLINRTVSNQKLPPETVKKYKGSKVYEFKIKGTAVRGLCEVEEGQVILLCGATKTGAGKGKLHKGDVQEAENLLAEFKANKVRIVDA